MTFAALAAGLSIKTRLIIYFAPMYNGRPQPILHTCACSVKPGLGAYDTAEKKWYNSDSGQMASIHNQSGETDGSSIEISLPGTLFRRIAP